MNEKCSDTGCNQREQCLRNTAKDDGKKQKYYVKSPRWNNECDKFFRNEATVPESEKRETLFQQLQDYRQDNAL